MTNNIQKVVDIPGKENAAKELAEILLSFTPDQLDRFLNHPITVSILRPEAAAGSDLPEVS